MSDWLLYQTALRDLIRPRRLLAAAPLIVLPAVLALLWRMVSRPGEFPAEFAYDTLCGGLIFGFTLVILAVLFGTGVVSQDVDGRTIVYLLTRPVPRWRILLAKFMGAFTGIVLTVWLSTALLAVVTFGGAAWRTDVVTRDIGVLAIGSLAYGALFLLTAAALNRPLIYGLFFAFGWESWVPLLPGGLQRVSVMLYLRTLAPHAMTQDNGLGVALPSGPSRLIERKIDVLGTLLSPVAVSTQAAGWTLAGISIVALALALLVFSRKEYAPREDAE
jgi:ABC-2 type transport system permease protein